MVVCLYVCISDVNFIFCFSSRSMRSSGSVPKFYGKRVTSLNQLFIDFTDDGQGTAHGTGPTSDEEHTEDSDNDGEGATEEEEGATGGDLLDKVPGNEVVVQANQKDDGEDNEEESSEEDDEDDKEDEEDKADEYLAKFINKSGPVS